MCDGLLKDDDDEVVLDDEQKKAKGLPKHILTKKKLIAIGGSQEAEVAVKKDSVNGGGSSEAGQGDVKTSG